MPFQIGGGKGGAGGGSLSVKNTHIFTSNTARDTYFNNNPSELVADLTVTSSSSLQKRVGSSWVDVSAVIKGQTGTSGTNGDDAPQVVFNYSADGLTGWSTTLNPALHKYWRWSTDGGVTWSADGVRFNSEGTGVSTQQASDITANTAARHNHANKSILDNTTGTFTAARESKLDGVQDTWKGSFSNATELNTTYPTPTNNWSALNRATGTVWSVVAGVWADTGASSTGDMAASVYDPQGVANDVFSRANHSGNQAISTITGLQTELDKITSVQGEVDGLDNQINNVTTGIIKAVTDIDTQINQVGTGVKARVTVLEALSGASGGPSVGDSKFSYKIADHDGWYVLNGRNISTLSVTAQVAAATLGWTTTIPDTQGRFALAASPSFLSGTAGGTNTIARSSLPNATLSGVTGNESTTHTHLTNSYTLNGTANSAYATSTTNPNVIAYPASHVPFTDNGPALTGTSTNSYLAFTGADKDVVDMDTSHTHSTTATVPDKASNANTVLHTHNFATSSINGGVVQTTHIPTYSAKTELVFLGL